MKTLSIDVETYSGSDLAKSGVHRYTESPDFEILLFGYAADGGEVRVVDLASGEQLPEEIHEALTDPGVTKWAFNAAFERTCLSRFLGLPTGTYLDPKQWKCSMVWSAYLGLPLSLKGVGAVLGLDKQKLDEGKELIRYFCGPCKPTAANGMRTRNLSSDAPEKWELFKIYNRRDVEVELQIQRRLRKHPVPDFVWDEYRQDQEINDRGVALDETLVNAAIEMDGRSRGELTAAMQTLTTLDNPNSVMQMKKWLSENGLETDTLGKKTVAELLKAAPAELADVLALRQQLAKSSVRKYTAMRGAVCSDGRARGMFQFYGANRTGRWAGRLIQMQNLPQNHLPDLSEARALVRNGDFEAVEMLYEDVPDTLSQLIRTAFVPRAGKKFIVSDFSAIEARVIAWLSGEGWRLRVFEEGKDIYCMSASQMFKVPVEKHGVNGHLRQKGKIAELACIAEGQQVLTDSGLVAIESVTPDMRVWDGESWVRHDGVVYRGEREVIEYEGLTATPDHLVWVEGQSRPIWFGLAAAGGAHLIQTGDGRKAIRLGEDYLGGEAVECENEPLLCTDAVRRLREHPMAKLWNPFLRKIERLSAMFSTKANSEMARQTAYRGKATMLKSKLPGVLKLRCKRDTVSLPDSDGGRTVLDRAIRFAGTRNGNRPNQQQFGLCKRKPALCYPHSKQPKQATDGTYTFRTEVLAICSECGNAQTVSRSQSGRDNSGCGECGIRETKELANHRRTAQLYDLRNAGRYHRFTVSGALVHNCGYGGSVGALKAMGALDMGLTEDELPGLVSAWRQANPHIVRFWWDVDRAVTDAVGNKRSCVTHGLNFSYESGMLFILLPSGRRLAYVKPRISENRFGGECVTYEGVGTAKKWERLESYGPKFVENITQAVARDVLAYAMGTLKDREIVMHIHDEVVIEADRDLPLQTICERMGRTPAWAKGLTLRADGYECEFYRKD